MKLFLFILWSTSLSAQEISLSFDDAPRGDGSYFSALERAKTIVSELSKVGVNQAIFYANPGKVKKPKHLDQLLIYKRAGHLIGNHTFDHISANRTTPLKFLESVAIADDFLRNKNLLSPYFRYPYLHRGNTLPHILKIRDGIESMGYIDGYITIDNYDYYMDRLFQKALMEGKKVNLENLKHYYVDTLMKSIRFYDNLAKKFLGHSPKHVLLLHENDLAALFVGKLVEQLRKEGWKIISPAEAYKDKDLASFPNVLIHNQGRVAAKAKESGYIGKLSSGFEDEKVLEELFDSYDIVD